MGWEEQHFLEWWEKGGRVGSFCEEKACMACLHFAEKTRWSGEGGDGQVSRHMLLACIGRHPAFPALPAWPVPPYIFTPGISLFY